MQDDSNNTARYSIELAAAEAAKGCSKEILVDGQQYTIDIPAGTQAGDVFELRTNNDFLIGTVEVSRLVEEREPVREDAAAAKSVKPWVYIAAGVVILAIIAAIAFGSGQGSGDAGTSGDEDALVTYQCDGISFSIEDDWAEEDVAGSDFAVRKWYREPLFNRASGDSYKEKQRLSVTTVDRATHQSDYDAIKDDLENHRRYVNDVDHNPISDDSLQYNRERIVDGAQAYDYEVDVIHLETDVTCYFDLYIMLPEQEKIVILSIVVDRYNPMERNSYDGFYELIEGIIESIDVTG